jgi:hypothetical protein
VTVWQDKAVAGGFEFEKNMFFLRNSRRQMDIEKKGAHQSKDERPLSYVGQLFNQLCLVRFI